MSQIDTVAYTDVRHYTDANGDQQEVRVNRGGLITDPGKYEGSPWWAPAADELIMQGCVGEELLIPVNPDDPDDDLDHDGEPADADGDFFELCDHLREAWELPNSAVAIVLWRNNQGFVHGQGLTADERTQIRKAYRLDG